MNINNLLKIAIETSLKAGQEILKIYDTDFGVDFKSDESPLTLADQNAHKVIVRELEQTQIPIMSEEGKILEYEERKNWDLFWLIDPLDGTKEFVKRNGEFTVNIALIEHGSPILGVVYVPVTDEMFFGDRENGAFKLIDSSGVSQFHDKAQALPIKDEKRNFTVVASRSHLTAETSEFINELKKDHAEIEIMSSGRSLKICMIAEGKADVYPRFAPTSEWDTAAGHAVVKAMGGVILQAENRSEELIYNKKNILNPWFIAYAKQNS